MLIGQSVCNDITLHYITLHYITLHYITHYLGRALQTGSPEVHECKEHHSRQHDGDADGGSDPGVPGVRADGDLVLRVGAGPMQTDDLILHHLTLETD